MRMVDIIEKKRDGGRLSDEEIGFFVQGLVSGEIPDYQASALLMAILFRGMDEEETRILTERMEHSGDTIDLSSIEGITVDKHSTGGVGDKTSIALGPLVAACGAKLAKMSGRGLGHTGGTLDKLESIPGFRVQLSVEEFVSQVNRIGLSIIGQTSAVDPADKKLYALRDVTGTVESIPLIASSIMSKKLAAGAKTILLDVKYGRGAFMKTYEKAEELARLMVKIGNGLRRDTKAILTGMEEPLGLAVGNSLEVKEAVESLHGRGPRDFMELLRKAGGIMLLQAGIVPSEEEGERRILSAIEDGSGFRKLREMVAAQGGDVSYVDDLSRFPVARRIIPVMATRSGHVSRIDSLEIGLVAMRLGAGRARMDDLIDHSAGILLRKKVGDAVREGEVLLELHTNAEDESLWERSVEEARGAYEISDKPQKAPDVVAGYIAS